MLHYERQHAEHLFGKDGSKKSLEPSNKHFKLLIVILFPKKKLKDQIYFE